MMRLSPPGYAKFSQATTLELVYGGGEANVAISLAYLGMEAAHVTRFPDNALGKAATQFLRMHWLNTDHVLYGGDMIGKYFLEKGAVHRSSEVIYEREGSSFSQIQPSMIDWQEELRPFQQVLPPVVLTLLKLLIKWGYPSQATSIPETICGNTVKPCRK